MKRFLQILAVFILLVAAVQAQDGIIVRRASVYVDASNLSSPVGQIQAGSRVSVFGRKGGWKEIFSEEKSVVGWVRSYQVREGDFAPQVETETKSDSRGFLAGLAAFSRKASGFFKRDSSSTSSGTATIGVRGLSEAEINSAVADFAELEKMKQFASNPKRVSGFANQGALAALKVPHFSGPKK